MSFQPWQATGKSKHSVAKRTPCDCGITHDSRREQRRCAELRLLEKAGVIAGLKQQPFYGFSVNGKPIRMENGHQAGWKPDFSYVDCRRGTMCVEDVKGRSKLSDSADYPLRKAIFRAFYPMVELREVRG